MGIGAGLYMYDVVVKRSRSLSNLLMSSCTCMQVPTVHVCRNCNKRKRDSAVAQGVSIFALLHCEKVRNTRNDLECHKTSSTLGLVSLFNILGLMICFCSRPNHDYILHCFRNISTCLAQA